MSTKGKIKRLLPGGNTSLGFFSYFDYIIDLKDANKVYFLKGGPGVGKSHMMKEIGNEMTNQGYDIEFHHCSADPDSIDAVVIPKLKVAVFDGTSPHRMDPKYPGAVDEIINLGEFWDEGALRKKREEIIEATDENSRLYKRVYKYLEAAKAIHDDIEWTCNQAMDAAKFKEASMLLEKKIFNGIEIKDRLAQERHLFGSAYTHKGHIDYVETYMNDVETIYHLKGYAGTGKSSILERVAQRAMDYGYDVEFYHEPLVPKKIKSIIIPELDIAVTTHVDYQDRESIDLNKFINREKFYKYKEELEYSTKLFQQLIDDVIYNLGRTKKNHDFIEKFYVPNIDFTQVDEVKNRLIKNILVHS
ncbi:MAG: PRK06851 family protein [Clostridiaceae bacterium]|nr:PRK06851 family protein [Clostridiaceae bacterium]